MASAWSWWSRLGAMLLVGVLAGCASSSHYASYRGLRTSPGHYYPPPGPPDDPWGPYVDQASARFGVPPAWIRAVMRQESGGHEQVISSAGAMGLMQVMPQTYAELRDQYALGNDPFEPHDNIMAGAAYIREMYDRYGAPGFLAAYNAGPNRLDQYLSNGTPLPDETVSYVASIAPRLNGSATMSGPLSVYAGTGGGVQYAAASPSPTLVSLPASPGGSACDPDAAYDPDQPCAPAAAAVAVATAPAVPTQSVLYQPAAPPVPTQTQSVLYQPPAYQAPAYQTPAYQAPAYQPPAYQAPARPAAAALVSPPRSPAPLIAAADVTVAGLGAAGTWGIQVGAFQSPELARAATSGARSELPGLLASAQPSFPLTEPFGTTRLYRARLTNLSAQAAAEACSHLQQLAQACIVVQPDRS
ncbi:MAG TPA: transglycosylase SLT domain-containing protein [Acetobacteraceae bacterium]